jgi:hypothetical protein
MNLLITTIGEYNHSNVWSGGNYDVHLIDYRKTPGFKYPLIAEAVKDLRYDYYWMPDEDIYATSEQIDAIFEGMRTYRLDLAQPSVKKSNTSFPSWELFIHREGADFISTRFVEVMCPCFSRRGLERCLETFPKSNSGWGLDLAWAKLLDYQNMGIINSVAIKHTRQPTSNRFFRPGDDMERLMAEYGIKEIDVR